MDQGTRVATAADVVVEATGDGVYASVRDAAVAAVAVVVAVVANVADVADIAGEDDVAADDRRH